MPFEWGQYSIERCQSNFQTQRRSGATQDVFAAPLRRRVRKVSLIKGLTEGDHLGCFAY
jgi:hypothetical protein